MARNTYTWQESTTIFAANSSISMSWLTPAASIAKVSLDCINAGYVDSAALTQGLSAVLVEAPTTFPIMADKVALNVNRDNADGELTTFRSASGAIAATGGTKIIIDTYMEHTLIPVPIPLIILKPSTQYFLRVSASGTEVNILPKLTLTVIWSEILPLSW